MVKARTWFTLFMVSLGTIAATASCGSDEATGGNAGGGSIITAGNAGASGHAGSVGRAGANSVGGGGPVGNASLGSECASNANCSDGMVCLTPDGTELGDGGPSNGMCTLPCTMNSECDALLPGANCWDFGTALAPKAYCMEACIQGGTAADAAGKCQGRKDFACVDLSDPNDATAPPDPFCLPQCIADADCGSGLYCEKGSVLGLCTKTKPVGDPVGTACDPAATTSTCKGFCLRTTDSTPAEGACAEFCVGGTACMYTGTNPGGLCVGQWGVGDLGYCEPACGCTSECPFPGTLCRKWTDAEGDLATGLASDGLCFPVLQGSVELTCGEGGAGGAGGAGGESAGGAGGDGTLPGAGGAAGSH